MSLMERLEKQKNGQTGTIEPRPLPREQRKNDVQPVQPKPVDPNLELKKQVQREVIDLINKDLNRAEGVEKNSFIRSTIDSVLNVKAYELSRQERHEIAQELFNDIVGLGPIEPLLASPDVTEVMVNGFDQVYVDIGGKIQKTNICFRDDAHVMSVINRIVTAVGRRIDESSPIVDARLEDGSRVNAIIPPVALTVLTLTIRKFSKNPLTVSDLMRFGSATPQMFSFLEACVKAKLNIVVSGGTGSGKTTLLSVLSAYIPENERIVTIEDAAELQLRQEHVITLESKPANVEGKGAVTIRDLVRNALRMRPDRIVVGEVRSGEALDMLQAMNTGHDGSLTTGHANSPRDMMSRLETMVLMSGMDMPVKAIREQISSALDLVVQQSRLRDGSRKIVSISEVVGMEGDTITLQDIFVYKPAGMGPGGKAGFYPTGVRPNFLDKMVGNGVPVREEWFQVGK